VASSCADLREPKVRERGDSEKMDKVAREDVPAWHAPILVEQLATPPPVLGRGGDGDDIVRLEIELFRDRRGIVVKCSYCIEKQKATKRSASAWQERKKGKEKKNAP
jgi:hypothetical protein